MPKHRGSLSQSLSLLIGLACMLASFACLAAAADPMRPNIVILLADDMGYGEIHSLNPERGKIPTPHLDAIAADGMVFRDAHSGSSVCTPTRYGLMTGRYAWRTRLQAGVLTGGPSLIDADRLTLAKLVHAHDYHTAVIGKWHLGMLFDGKTNAKTVPVGSRVSHGPRDRGGFDIFQGFHHARQIETWIDQDTVTAQIEAVDMLPRLTRAAVDYIALRAADREPFLLYVPWSSPHSPVVPSPAWRGRSGLNAHADFVMQTDDCIGQVITALRAGDLLDNTLVLCSSDNGTSAPTSNKTELESKGHFPSGPLRGSKADIWDGGHRVPFLVSWPAVVKPGSTCDRLVCLTDVLATVADILGERLPDDAGEDSFSFLPALRGEDGHQRDTVIHHSIAGYFGIRDQSWKLACCPDSGGWSDPKPSKAKWLKLQAKGEPLVQLYDLRQDLAEQTNLAAQCPERVAAMRSLLDQQIASGRSTPGQPQANDATIVVDKFPGR